MNREQARKNWEVIKAYGEGKELQYRKIGETEWHDERKHLGFCFDVNDCEFRIKPEDASIVSLPNESCYKCGKKLTLENMADIILASNPPKYMCKKCAGEDTEENYTIEQNTGENRFEGGVLSVSGSVSEKHYKPFEDTAELMVHYSKHFNIDFPPFYEPIIWVKRKDNDSRFLITGYDELDVFLEDCWQDLNDLYEQYVFLDSSPVGKLEE